MRHAVWGDDDIIQKAYAEHWVLITGDKDFGDKVYRERRPHRGVVLLCRRDERVANKIGTLRRLLEGHAERLPGQFAVATDEQVRFARTA